MKNGSCRNVHFVANADVCSPLLNLQGLGVTDPTPEVHVTTHVTWVPGCTLSGGSCGSMSTSGVSSTSKHSFTVSQIFVFCNTSKSGVQVRRFPTRNVKLGLHATIR